MAKIRIEVPGNPQALKRHRTYTHDRKGRPLKFPRKVDPSASDKMDFLALAMAQKPETPLLGPIEITAEFYMPRPKGHYSTAKNSLHKVKASAPTWHTSRGDLDNLLKFVIDALDGVFYRSDAQICRLGAIKIYADNPKVVIDIEEL